MTISEFVNAFNKLKHQQTQLEKNELDLLKFLKTYIDSKVEEEYGQIKTFREQEFLEIQTAIKDIVQSLKNIKNLLSKENVEDTDTCILKDNMMSFQINLHSLKTHLQTELDDLVQNEHILQHEIIVTQGKICDIRKQLTYSKNYTSCSKQNIQKDTPFFQEVQDFANYVNKFGGHDGGWAEEDHLIFSKIYKRHNEPEKIIKATRKVMPEVPDEDIQAHLDWYSKYLDLKSKQKQAIKEWKQSKIINAKKPENKEENTASHPKKQIKRQNDEITQMKQKLSQWKTQKQLKCQQSLECESRELFRVKQIEKEMIEQRKKVKKEILKWRNAVNAKQKDEQMEKEIITLREKERKAAVANKLIKEFQDQDQHFINRRLANIQTDNQKTECVEKSTVKVPRDPARLLKPTKQWEARIARVEQNEIPNLFVGNCSVKEIQKLGIPEWRKSVL